ncbi:nitrilotriacetate monooxygenase [Arthrobacter sp. MYb227]|uniref:LLM class flavin-dependent oxidoreductase n=1 Tax=Arthrobacter sp. MYb227 TaxID=1848601 RepID=UPI000CFA98D3|nr:LLM class flavin-dependent oxidoreductase [Arthrobacter sp. MYb227]PQZ96384.1 nitrilotriacetate monooxygenase [Arthrobacter sp. MYb227]
MSTHDRSDSLLILEADGVGSHPAAWRYQENPSNALDIVRLARVVLSAESEGFHAVSFQDSRAVAVQGPRGGLDAIQRAAYLGAVTHSIGLLPVIDAIYTEPFHLATQLAGLDSISGGRAGWIVLAEGTEQQGAAVGRDALAVEQLAGEIADVVRVSRSLWDSWEDDAVIKDVATGRYLDRTKLHYTDFIGNRFSVKGPAISPRPIQGQLPVLVPETLATQGHDAVLFTAPDLDQLLTATGASAGARIAELEFVLDAAGESAASRLAQLNAWENWDSERARFVGSAEELITYLRSLLPLVAGVRLHPATLEIDAAEFSELVLPALRSTNLLADLSTGATLRSTFGLPPAKNQFAHLATNAI